jgi:nicotinamide riboside transporter PnuC
MWLIMIVNNHLVVIIWLLYGDYMVIICLMMVHNHLVGGIATYPSEKSRSEDCQLG